MPAPDRTGILFFLRFGTIPIQTGLEKNNFLSFKHTTGRFSISADLP